MTILFGAGTGLRPILGRAAYLKIENGRPTLTEETLAFLIERARLEEGEIRLVLVAEDALYALWMPLPGDAILVGVVAEREASQPLNPRTELAILTGVEGARQQIEEGHILLVDPAQGRVFVEPSAEEVIRVEARHRPRYLLGAAQTPAVTRTGVPIAVWARVQSVDEADRAVQDGAEGLYFDSEPDAETLERAAQRVGGGDVALAGSDDAALLLARRARAFQVVDPVGGASLSERRAAWQARARAAAEAGESRTIPGLMARLSADTPPEAAAGYDRALSVAGVPPGSILDLPPLWVRVESADAAGQAARAGAVGVVCPSDQVAAVKEAIRETD